MSDVRGETPQPVAPELLALDDRCDRCGSQAYVRVELATGALLFCAHHFQEHESRLRQVAARVVDERDRLHADAARGASYSTTTA